MKSLSGYPTQSMLDLCLSGTNFNVCFHQTIANLLDETKHVITDFHLPFTVLNLSFEVSGGHTILSLLAFTLSS